MAGNAAAGAGVGPEHAALHPRHHQGLHDARRRRAVPDRARRRRTSASTCRRVGQEFGAVTGRAAPLRLVRRRAAASARCRSTASPACASPSSTCSTASRRCKLCIGYELDGKRIDILPVGAEDARALRAGLRRAAGLEREHRRRQVDTGMIHRFTLDGVERGRSITACRRWLRWGCRRSPSIRASG